MGLIRTKTLEKGRALSLAIPHASRDAAVLRLTVIRKLLEVSDMKCILARREAGREGTVKDSITYLITIHIITTRVVPPAVLW